MSEPKLAPGPFRADQLREDDPYELSEGHAYRCLPTKNRGSRRNLTGAAVLDTDPAVEEAGVDTGFSPVPNMLRAPDVAVGNVPDAPGWVKGVPPLAVEYADGGQDEGDLERKICDLLAAGTRWVWVVRLTGPQRVEVREPGRPPSVVEMDGVLRAPGVLANPVSVASLFDRRAAHDATLRNLLQRQGYASVEAVREEGRTEGHEESLRAAIRDLCAVLDIPFTDERAASVAAMHLAELDQLRVAVVRARRWPA